MRNRTLRVGMITGFVACFVAALWLNAEEAATTAPADDLKSVNAPIQATPLVKAKTIKAKALSENVGRGLAWLVEHQHENGGWSQGEESANMGKTMDKVRDRPNVADTCAAVLALMRSGSSPQDGAYSEKIMRGIIFVCAQIEESPKDGLTVTDVNGTRLQAKIGQHVDTFLAALLLAEVKDRMPDNKGRERVSRALTKVLDKIEKNQNEDGTWDNRGWAPVLSQGLASKALNRAAQNGFEVDEDVRQRAEKQSRDRMSAEGEFGVAADSAGIELYASSANISALNESNATNDKLRGTFEQSVTTAPSSEVREEAKRELKRIDDTKGDLEKARKAIVQRVQDEQFVKGFGSNGGEEFLSYLNIGESLVVDGGEEWQKWDQSMTQNMNRIQNKDGSWTGHHCITGRTFCTSMALMVLMTDRAEILLAGEMRRR